MRGRLISWRDCMILIGIIIMFTNSTKKIYNRNNLQWLMTFNSMKIVTLLYQDINIKITKNNLMIK